MRAKSSYIPATWRCRTPLHRPISSPNHLNFHFLPWMRPCSGPRLLFRNIITFGALVFSSGTSFAQETSQRVLETPAPDKKGGIFEFLKGLFDQDFMPHGHCYFWRPEIVWLHAASDALIAIAYCSIPLTLFYIIRRRQDIVFSWLFVLFASFIFACGMTHLLEVWTLWHPVYRLSGLVKLATASISVVTAISLWKVFPLIALLPSPAQLEEKNRELRKEISERQEAELRISRANELLAAQADELRRSNAELGQYAYVASHDLREPLRAVAGCAEILQWEYKGKLDAQGDELLAHTIDGANRMQALISDLLAYSQVGKKEARFESFSASAALSEALINLEESIRETGATIENEGLPVVWADRIQMIQLLQNLVGNAIKYHRAPAPVILIRAVPETECTHFTVSDNGIGIESQNFERIFGVFQRLHTRKEYSGTGIGLAICKKIVEFHRGRIWVESELGKGSTFHFTIANAVSFKP